jgi:hypothetical protein
LALGAKLAGWAKIGNVPIGFGRRVVRRPTFRIAKIAALKMGKLGGQRATLAVIWRAALAA